MTAPDPLASQRATFSTFADIVATAPRPLCDKRNCTSPAFAWMQHDGCGSLPRLLCDVHGAQFRALIDCHTRIGAKAWCSLCGLGFDPDAWHVNPI